MAVPNYLIAVGLVFATILFSGCSGLCPPQGPWPMPPWCVTAAQNVSQGPESRNVTVQSGSVDEFGCLPSDCSTLPEGTGRDFCEQYRAGTYVWGDCSAYPSEECRALCRDRTGFRLSGQVTFEADVPSNTPAEDVVFIQMTPPGDHPGSYYMKQMTKVNSSTWRISLSMRSGTAFYKYNRGNMGFLSDEEFSPDSESARRSANVTAGGVVRDTITKWRWFPSPGEILPSVPTAAASTPIQDRIGGERFQRGYMLVDFWWPSFHDLISPTDAAMKAGHGNWVQIRPTWDYIQSSPLPVIGYEEYGHTYKPGDLEFNIAQSQEDGLDVLLMPQVCCHNPPGDGTYSQEWWGAWFAQMENYSIHFADLAESNGIEYMVMQDDYLWGTAYGQLPDFQQKYAHYLSVIRQHYSGKLGLFVSTGSSYKWPDTIYPSMEETAAYSPEQMDFFAISMWTGVTDSNDPTVAEMRSNFKLVFDSALKPIYEKYHKPIIIVSAAYPSIDGGMRGQTDVFDNDTQVWYAYTDKYSLDLVEQAQGYEALMQAIAETPYITGLYPFTYWPLSLPMTKEHNIRGKPAEQVVSEWYAQYEKQGK